ncbi:response regulator transcription factor [Bacillus sp. DNRA2]|uniref:response regulator transcription factor n=1 Tax=Bacillus sp. DNRA2 TaxID=2723053 RepID=UPI00145D19F5|nr:response regulator transcription factor [Bacillus sp. DNRA2]NMD71013.1 response regulator transcription factor [Bacillus sp. DNRA2]
MYKIALVEDDPELSSIISKMLLHYQYEIVVVEDFTNVVDHLIELNPDVILLDINLPYLDGFHICKAIRKKSNVPIIITSARNTDADQILGVELGADDYVVKPFSVEVLHSKIKASIRRAYGSFHADKTNQVIGEFQLDFNTFTLSYHNKRVELTKNEFKIMKYLSERPNCFVPREDLLTELWDDVAFVDNNTLNVNISRIKTKLADIGIHEAIHTKRGYGYQFVPYWLESQHE